MTDFVSKYISAIKNQEDDAKEAALILGLLVEREKVYRPIPSDDGGLSKILGEEFSDRRLSNVEVAYIVDELIDYINTVETPQPRAVWALTKSYEPRIIPHLINLLDRFIEEPNQEDLVYQSLTFLVNFYDEQSIAAIQRAAKSGHGRVKQAAENYLYRFFTQVDKGGNFIKKHIRKPERVFEVEGQIYRLQRRPAHSQVFINDKYQGIRIIDPWREIEVWQSNFTKGYAQSGVIDGWCFRSDGNAVLVLNEKNRTGSVWYVAENRAYDLAAPSLREITDLRYIWEDDSFWITGGNTFAFFRFENETSKFNETASIHARIAHRSWCQTLDQLKVLESQVLRVEPDESRLIYYDFSKLPEEIGVLSWRSKQENWSISTSKYAPISAYQAGHIFLMYADVVHAVDQQLRVKSAYHAPEGYVFSGLDVLPAQEQYPPSLVLACTALDKPQQSQIVVYALDYLKG